MKKRGFFAILIIVVIKGHLSIDMAQVPRPPMGFIGGGGGDGVISTASAMVIPQSCSYHRYDLSAVFNHVYLHLQYQIIKLEHSRDHRTLICLLVWHWRRTGGTHPKALGKQPIFHAIAANELDLALKGLCCFFKLNKLLKRQMNETGPISFHLTSAWCCIWSTSQ